MITKEFLTRADKIQNEILENTIRKNRSFLQQSKDMVAQFSKMIPKGSPQDAVEKTLHTALLFSCDDDGVYPADAFFFTFYQKRQDDMLIVNAIRRSILSMFYVQKKDGKMYELIDTKTAASYPIQTVDDLPIHAGDAVFSSIIPAPDGRWYFSGGIMNAGPAPEWPALVELARKKIMEAGENEKHFRNFFGSCIVQFATRAEAEKRLGDCFEAWNREREKENVAMGKKPTAYPVRMAFKLPPGIPTPPTAMHTPIGLVFVNFYEQYQKLAQGHYPKQMRKELFQEMLVSPDVFDDAILLTLYNERKEEFLRMAAEAYDDVTDDASLRKKLSYFRPQLFDPKMPHVVLANGETEDIWGMSHAPKDFKPF